MWKRILLWGVLSASLCACAIAVPVQEAEPPEVLGNWGFRIGYFQGAAPMLATPSATITDAQADRTPIVGYRLGFGFLNRFELDTDLYAGIASAGSSVSLRYQWTGDTYFHAKTGNFAQTTVIRIWGGGATDAKLDDQFQYQYGDLEGHGQDLSHFWGYRMADWAGIYGGPKVISGTATAKYKNSDGGTIVETESRHFWGGGGIFGINISPHSKHIGFDVNFEAQCMNLPKTYSTERDWYSTYTLSLSLPFSFAD